jgi:ribosomal protein S18 acetylase RimI-like enzyme
MYKQREEERRSDMSNILPQGYIARPALITDLPAMYALGQARQLAVYGEVDFTIEDLHTLCQAPDFDLAEQACLVFDTSGQLIVVAYFEHHAWIRYSVTLDVLPGHEDGNLRAYLMQLGEMWARRQMLKAPLHACTFLRAWVSSRDVSAIAWLEAARDFAEVRRFWDMQITLSETPPAALWPRGVQVRPFEPACDSRAVFEADEAFFRDHWGSLPQDYQTWRHWTIERADFDPALWFVAYAGEDIVGISLCKDGEKGWVDTLGVARAWRGRGLGLALLYHSFGEFYRRGRSRVGLGVDAQSLTGAPRLYERAGMHIARQNLLYEKQLRAGIDLIVRELAI